MSAIPKPITSPHADNGNVDSAVNEAFLRYLPAVTTHASIQFRHLPKADREEAIAEARAAAFENFRQASRNGKSHRITPGTLANYAVLHAASGRHVGGRADSKSDVMSPRAQRLRGFKVLRLPWDSGHAYDCLKDPTSPVWNQVLLDDRSTPVPDQAAFRIDLSDFLRQQHDRTRQTLSMLADGYKQVEVADRLGVTPAAVCQRVKKAEREWMKFQGDTEPESAIEDAAAAPTPVDRDPIPA